MLKDGQPRIKIRKLRYYSHTALQNTFQSNYQDKWTVWWDSGSYSIPSLPDLFDTWDEAIALVNRVIAEDD